MEPTKAPPAASPAHWKMHTAGKLEFGVGIIAFEGLGLGFVSKSVSGEEFEESKVAIFFFFKNICPFFFPLSLCSYRFLGQKPDIYSAYLYTTSFAFTYFISKPLGLNPNYLFISRADIFLYFINIL